MNYLGDLIILVIHYYNLFILVVYTNACWKDVTDTKADVSCTDSRTKLGFYGAELLLMQVFLAERAGLLCWFLALLSWTLPDAGSLHPARLPTTGEPWTASRPAEFAHDICLSGWFGGGKQVINYIVCEGKRVWILRDNSSALIGRKRPRPVRCGRYSTDT